MESKNNKQTKKKYVKLQTTGVPADYKEKGDQRAREEGLGSLQDVVRLFVKSYAERKVDISAFTIPTITNPKVIADLQEAWDEYLRGEAEEIGDIDEHVKELLDMPDE